jgi:hypothetical protein
MQVACNKIPGITTGSFTTRQTLSEAAESEITHSKATKDAKKVSNENLEPAVLVFCSLTFAAFAALLCKSFLRVRTRTASLGINSMHAGQYD